MKAQRKSDTC